MRLLSVSVEAGAEVAMETGRSAVLAHITGRVQGVGFRAWTRSEALGRDLKGWLRNEPDGSVTALFMGPEPSISEIIRALWKGPPAALVFDLRIEAVDTAELPTSFTIERNRGASS